MTTYLITYDLLKPGQDYKSIHEAIRRLDPSVWHGLESVWVLRSSSSAAQVRSNLTQFIDSNDRLLIIATSPEWAAKNLPDLAKLHGEMGTVPA